MPDFPGFTSSETFTSVPDSLFHLLGEIDDLDELKLTLYVLWRLAHAEARARCVARAAMAADESFSSGLTPQGLETGLEKAVRRGTLLHLEQGDLYFLNSPTGRATLEALQKDPARAADLSTAMAPRTSSNIFKLYEENIGPLTPLIADALKDAETFYPPELIAEAFGEAVKMNKRNWKYVEAILRRWKEEGRAKKQNRPDVEADRGSDVLRKVEEFRKRTR